MMILPEFDLRIIILLRALCFVGMGEGLYALVNMMVIMDSL